MLKSRVVTAPLAAPLAGAGTTLAMQINDHR
jgi:hypothetical protein